MLNYKDEKTDEEDMGENSKGNTGLGTLKATVGKSRKYTIKSETIHLELTVCFGEC